MIEIGRICVKIAGRDAGKQCVVVDIIDDNHVLIDGETRRRKCNITHLEPTNRKIAVKKGADHAAVSAAFKELGIELPVKKPKKKAEPKAEPAKESAKAA